MAYNSEYDLPDVWNVPEEPKPPQGWFHYHPDLSFLRKLINKPTHVIPVTIPGLICRNRQKVNAAEFADAYKENISFEELDANLVVLADPIGLTRTLPDGKVETYPDKLEDNRKNGINESASYGTGVINGKRIAAFISNWGFMGASSGRVYGEKIVRVTELAIKKNFPAFMLYSSGGQRMQEAAGALKEMDRTGHFIRKFKRLRKKPIISVLDGDVWGGVTASDVKEGDIVLGMAGTNFGFAGPGVIKGYTGERPPEGVQTVEHSFLTNRTVHAILNSQEELQQTQETIVDFAYRETPEYSLQTLYRRFKNICGSLYRPHKSERDLLALREEARGLNFEARGFHTPLQFTVNRNQGSRADIIPAYDPIEPDSVYNQHRILRSDPRRPDTEYIIQNGFDGYLPLYSHWTNVRKDGIYQRSPAIIAALAHIDDPRLPRRLWAMVIGNQPNYLKLEDGCVIKEPASATAWDFRYQLDMMRTAGRFGIPVVSFTDILGAKPTEEEEVHMQYGAISDCLAAKDEFPGLQLGFITGVEGSGGGLATNLDRDHVEILDDAQVFVAEPESAARIIVKDPTRADIERITEQMKPTATSLKELGLVDYIIDTEGGAQNNPFEVAQKIRERIIIDYLKLGGLSAKQLKKRAEKRLDNLKPIPIGILNSPPEEQNLLVG